MYIYESWLKGLLTFLLALDKDHSHTSRSVPLANADECPVCSLSWVEHFVAGMLYCVVYVDSPAWNRVEVSIWDLSVWSFQLSAASLVSEHQFLPARGNQTTHAHHPPPLIHKCRLDTLDWQVDIDCHFRLVWQISMWGWALPLHPDECSCSPWVE